MWLQIKLNVFIFIVLRLNFAYCFCTDEATCPDSPCLSYNPQQVVANIWKSAQQPLTPLISKFRDEILRLINNQLVNDRQTGVLIGQTLWAVDRLTDFNPSLSPSCVYSKLIHESNVANAGINNREDLNNAIMAYSKLSQLAISNSLNIGLLAAGCPTTLPPPRNSKIVCPLNLKSLYRSLMISQKYIPITLRNIIIQLINSNNADEKIIGLAAIASATESSAEYFSRVSRIDIFFKLLQLKSCDVKIQPQCCDDRKKALEELTISVKNAARDTFNDIIRENV